MLTSTRVRTCTARRRRGGFTIAELLIVLALGAIVLGITSSVGLGLQRHLSSASSRLAAAEQLAAAAEVIPLDLRGLAPAAGDIAIGGARDTSLEVRATIASAMVCAATPSTVTLAFHRGPSGQAPSPRAQSGDTIWLLADGDTAEAWRRTPILALRRVPGGCVAAGSGTDDVFDVTHPWSADIRDTVGGSPPTIARITRPERVSLYRASDGRWYLGLRTWNSAAGQFAGIQPVSGPYRSPSFQGGSRFRYFDSASVSIASGVAYGSGIARVELALATDPSSSPPGTSPDSLTIVVALRNRNE